VRRRTEFARAARLVLTAAFIGIAVWLLRDATRQIEVTEITQGLKEISPRHLFFALLATVGSFTFIGALDALSLKDIAPGRVPMRLSMATGAAATAVSNLLGAAYVTGVGVRYRVYSTFGIGGAQVASLFVYNSLAYTLGALVLYGGVLSIHPASIEKLLPISELLQTVIGLSLLGLTALCWAGIGMRAGKPVHVFGREIPMPGFGTGVGLTAAVVFDLVASGLVLHTLYPPDLSIGFLEFLAVFGIAISLGILSHSPGGLGVFEATILTATGAHGRADALAALILYRAVYTLLPFLVAMLAAAVFEARRNRAGITYAGRLVLRILGPVCPGLKIALALGAGGSLVLSGTLHPMGPRLDILQETVPRVVAAAAPMLSTVSGVLLLVGAGALYLRLRVARALTMGALALGIAAVLAQGFAVAAAVLLCVFAIPLWALHRDFGDRRR